METKHNDEIAQLRSQLEKVLAEKEEELNTLIQKYTTEKANLMNELDGKSSVYRNTTEEHENRVATLKEHIDSQEVAL